MAGDPARDVAGRTIDGIRRRGKFLMFGLSGGRMLVVNPMLTGAFQYCPPSERTFKRTCFILALDTGAELRYLDERQMGRVYWISDDQLHQVPQFEDMGPDVLDDVSFEEFRRRLARFHGEIKGVLTRGRVTSGIGNAYADEILFHAKVYPFRRRKELTEDELRRIHRSAREVIEEAVPQVRERIGERIHTKARDFLRVHNRGGEACPNCGNPITQLTANQRITSYCRRCQPGLLLKR
jgi:formamidopyrimidine-DNA glycosylase